ncbi:putative phosphoglycerate mutase [Cladobotryum mycophilum]|uniref:Phosphoglycerate mutase n=1 Tax=Cladobotryum mycophilum TaxID=491253 RepID=A0ABR0SZ62_9HYPO
MTGNRWTFHAEPGFFVDLAEVFRQSRTKVTTQPSLALLSRPYPTDDHDQDAAHQKDWVRFAAHVKALNRDAPDNVCYKVLYLTRHGLGFHNKKHAEVGPIAWETKWSLMDGDGEETWFDSFLTETGVQQVQELGRFWAKGVENDGIPLPQTLYTSPLARCLQTSYYIFSPLMEANKKPFRPIIKEKLRERYTLHTCDMRRPGTWIRENYPNYAIEEGFPEGDLFRSRDREETVEEHKARKHAALEDIFSSDTNEFVALTIHSYAIAAVLLACNAEPFQVREGSSIALLVRGEKASASQ